MFDVTGQEKARRLAARIRKADDKRVIMKRFRQTVREPLPSVRTSVRDAAVRMLPRRGGLGLWVSRTRVGASVLLSSRGLKLTLRGGRSSATRKKSDIRSIDQGMVRHPTWGHKPWSPQKVSAGFFTKTIADKHTNDFVDAAVKAVEAFDREV